jgi:hypothetical protein
MFRAYVTATTVLAACFAVSAGCADSQRGGSQGAGGGKELALNELDFKLGEYMPPLEEGRLEIAPPEGWEFVRAGSEYVVAFVPKGRELNKLPRILLSAEESPLPDVTQVDSSNVESFVQKVKQLRSAEKLAEPVRAIVLGNNAFAHYVTMAKRKGNVVARMVLDTVANNRQYSLRLEVYDREFPKYRDAAYAVAAGMKFGGTPAETLPETEVAPPDAAAPEEKAKEEPKTEPAADT